MPNDDSRRARRWLSKLTAWFNGSEQHGPGSTTGGGLLAIFAATLVVSVLLPIVVNILDSKKLTGFDQFTIGVLVYIVLTTTSLAHHLRRLDTKATVDSELWQIRNDFDRRLNNVRESYYRLLSNRRVTPEFFQLYFERTMSVYEEVINEAVTNHELLVDENHLSTPDMLLPCFDGRERDIARFTHNFADNDWMFDTWAQNYCVRLVTLTRSGRLKQVRRLFIYDTEDERTDPKSQRLMEFHSSNAPHFVYRTIQRDVYNGIVNDFRMREHFRDFGIYGDWYVYRTLQATPEHIEGVFSSSERKIGDYIALFELCFRRGDEPIKSTGPPMSPEDLFGAPIVPIAQRLADGAAAIVAVVGNRETEGPFISVSDHTPLSVAPTTESDGEIALHNETGVQGDTVG